jgi:hypothetical protein
MQLSFYLEIGGEILIWVVLSVISLSICISALLFFAFDDSFNISENLIYRIVIFSFVLFSVFLFIGIISEEAKDRDGCEYIGGRYEVVGKETTMVLVGKVLVPQTIDVYGCVK